MIDPAIDEALDVIEGLVGHPDLSRAEVAESLEARGRAMPVGAPGRAVYLSTAGTEWGNAGDYERGVTCGRDAVEDGGDAYLNAHVEYVDILMKAGRSSEADETMSKLRQNLPADAVQSSLFDGLGEVLEEHGELRDSARWYTMGVIQAEESDATNADYVFDICLRGRHRIRRSLELPIDRYDELFEELEAERTASPGGSG